MMKNKMRALCLVLALFLVGCQTELYTNVSQKEGNEMLSILLSEGVVATKEPDKDNKVKLMVDSSQIAFAVDALKRKGYPREQFSTLKEVFPKDDLISSPLAERARLVYAKSQELSSTLSQIDGVLVARVHVVLEDQDLRPGERPTPASASVFIKHAADVALDSYVPQIKLLVNNSIEGLNYDRISVVMVPSSEVRVTTQSNQFKSILSVQVTKETANHLIGILVFMVLLLIGSNVATFTWCHRSAKRG
ncbi:TPA: SctJ family type III secretion inner membrane ring lipoprotein Vsc [Vibrio parahaemolyticus]|uniref:SctJ family type III secretion inner membrane ring lipoprotein Vsc n=1 Tax=Vibrio parahaemolyticus TaxID=670 RepID=UPI00111DD5C1|nr:SctJ family type III secretion inner membrane ring lipoprotein Vsc [Vibrio parahaemolyticus]EGQ8507348.1 EscJ/YscJ/HrcJ family type III secretion inner membrane ring protein [Vibrio parahaemolyticus]TOE31782.1 EscJ/YscJ/HrcJ family type III secretion inner membrane ring protein [Vibrio parahaemolyticus]HCH0814015.1 SctJ family type III secretion inner membrane ring lipoprotein Vsc [Vibrio parahaemolyticus]HCH0829759.1 SctJ family type III secretion inner membrane ring lipoprotein Vsc [Vibrio